MDDVWLPLTVAYDFICSRRALSIPESRSSSSINFYKVTVIVTLAHFAEDFSSTCAAADCF